MVAIALSASITVRQIVSRGARYFGPGALLSGAGLCAVALTLLLQSKELRLQKMELRRSALEMELGRRENVRQTDTLTSQLQILRLGMQPAISIMHLSQDIWSISCLAQTVLVSASLLSSSTGAKPLESLADQLPAYLDSANQLRFSMEPEPCILLVQCTVSLGGICALRFRLEESEGVWFFYRE